MKECHSCGASVRDDAQWCPQCYARFDTPEFEPEVERPDTTTEPAAGQEPWMTEDRDLVHPEAFPDVPHYRFSRFHSSQTTFGLVGRVLMRSSSSLLRSGSRSTSWESGGGRSRSRF